MDYFWIILMCVVFNKVFKLLNLLFIVGTNLNFKHCVKKINCILDFES